MLWLRKIDQETSELKRMYVKNEFRGNNIGSGLLQLSFELTRERGYKKIRLDTLQVMTKAQELYRSFGFYKIQPYCFNPYNGTIFMEKEL